MFKKNRRALYRALQNEHIQLLHDRSLHWLLTFSSNGRIHICDSLKTSLSRVNIKCVHALYKNCVKEFIVSFLLVQKQTDGYNCGPFAIAFAAEILDEKSPEEAGFDVERMRLTPFKGIRSGHREVFYKTGFVLELFCRKQNTSCSTPIVEKL